jgi:putative tryptophan/tyrosine transport system permease protein
MWLMEIISTLSDGLLFSFMGLGILLSYRFFHFMDMTTDGSFAAGAAVSMTLIAHGLGPGYATCAGFLAGMLVGLLTGLCHTRLGIDKMLAGIIIMIMMYSINMHVMSGPYVAAESEETLFTLANTLGASLFHSESVAFVEGVSVPSGDLVLFLGLFVGVLALSGALYFFLQTHAGLALRSAGENPAMARSVGINVNLSVLFAIALANGLTAISGALFAQRDGSYDISGGMGMIMLGLTGVIVGGALFGRGSLRRLILGAVLGVLLLRLLVMLILKLGLPPADFKLFNALFLIVVLVVPEAIQRRKRALARAAATSDGR